MERETAFMERETAVINTLRESVQNACSKLNSIYRYKSLYIALQK